MVAEGNPMALRAVNLTGLKRRDFSAERIATIRNMHKSLYRKSLTLEESKAEILAMRGDDAGVNGDVDTMLDFIAGGTRGLVR
jgi:UDP-N-acetylglucosamine acyltransferase